MEAQKIRRDFIRRRCRGIFETSDLRVKSLLSALLISRYILGLGQRGRCCFCAACPNRKMYLEISIADEGAFNCCSKEIFASYLCVGW